MANNASEELLDTLESACAFMRCAIGRTIDFTEANSGIGLTPVRTVFDLQTALNAPLKWIRSMLPIDGQVNLVLEPLPKGLVSIESDQRWLEENLLCLLSNGVKFSSSGPVRAVVSLNGDKVRITVEDNGVGIEAEARPKLFEQMSQVQRMTVGGSGLGLYSLSKRSEAIGGSCGVDDRSDGKHGASFWFEIPHQEVDEKIQNTAPGVSKMQLLLPMNAQSEECQSLNVLIVDDSIAVVKMLSNKLRSCGHRVTTAKNGAEGLEKMIATSEELDLVIMDLQMPVMDGIEATRRYREREREFQRLDDLDHNIPRGLRKVRHLPIICSSANCNGEAELRAVAAGVDSFLPKPFNMDALSIALKEALVSSSRTCDVSRDEIRAGSPL
jgi:CheY-like chemotaxis protein